MSSISNAQEGECFICYDVFTSRRPMQKMPCLCTGTFKIHKECLQEMINNNGVVCKTCNKRLTGLSSVEIKDIISKIKSDYIDLSDQNNIQNILNAHIKITLAYVHEYAPALQFVKEQTEEICIAALTGYTADEAFEYIKEFTPRMYLEAVKHFGSHIQFVKKHTPKFWNKPLPDGTLISYKDICLEAVKQNGNALQYISGEDQTYEICLEAIRKNGEMLEFVKDPTPLMCVEAVCKYGGAIQFIPNFNIDTWDTMLLENGEYTTYHKVCMIAVKDAAWALQFIEEQTNNICLMAVRKNGEMLKYCKKQKPFICLEAVRNTKKAIKHIRNFTYELSIKIIEINPSYVELLPNVTHEMCVEAISNDPRVYTYINDEFKTYKLCKLAIKRMREQIEEKMDWSVKAHLKIQLNRFEGQLQILKIRRDVISHVTFD
jgi:hypothetical protein